MDIRERWIKYCMKMECRICGESIFSCEEDAAFEVDAILKGNDFGTPDPSIDCLKAELSWSPHEGKYCDYHVHMLSKND